MKRTKIYFLIMLGLFSPRMSLAAPNLSDANRLLDFAESAEPALFFPPAETQQANAAAAGKDKYFGQTL